MIKEIKQLVESNFGIACPNMAMESKLGDMDIGLDSQEIVDFTCMLQKQFHLKSPMGCFNKSTTIQEVLNSLTKKQACYDSSHDSPLGSFEGKIEASIDIKCRAEDAYSAIYEMEKWPSKLPHVKHIETLYNDGTYQEFLMDVQSDSGLIKVRSIRRCIPGEGITFFQPNPPKFLKHHCGGWSFQQKGEKCVVKTWHQWNLEKQKAGEIFPAEQGKSTAERVAHVLRSHAELALETWKTRLECA